MNGRRWSVLSSKGQLSTARLLPRASICVWLAVWVGFSAESAMANLEPNRSGSANNVSMTSSRHTYSSSHNFVRPPSPAPILTGQAKLCEEGSAKVRLRGEFAPFPRGIVIRIRSFLRWAQRFRDVTQVDADASPCGRTASHRIDQHIVHRKKPGHFGMLLFPPFQPGESGFSGRRVGDNQKRHLRSRLLRRTRWGN